MKTQTACPACFIDDVAGAVELMELSETDRKAVISACADYLAEQLRAKGWERIPSAHITEVHRIVKRMTGDPMPFAKLRAACNAAGMEIAAQVRSETATMDPKKRFGLLVRWAIAGNHLDFRTVGTGYGFDVSRIKRSLAAIASSRLDLDDCAAIRKRLAGGGTMLYIPDNVGEIAFDALLIEEIRKYGWKVRAPYRGGPITSDAILEDFKTVGLDVAADEIFEAGPDTLGFSLEEMSPELEKALREADMVIAKGQANFYAITEIVDSIPGTVACLLRTKCAPATKRLGITGETAGVAVVLKQ